MWKILRILFTIIAALLVAAIAFIGMFFGIIGAVIDGFAALLFFLLALFCKKKQELPEKKKEEEEILQNQFDNLK